MNKSGIFLSLLAVAAIIAVNYSSVDSSQSEFDLWQQQYGFKFTTQKKIYRQMIFMQNLKMINEHNSNPQRSYDMGLNKFSYLSNDEFGALYSTMSEGRQSTNKELNIEEILATESNDIDWTKLGKVSKVKTQGQCDAGYAFCTISLAESYFLMKNKNITLSEQQVVDCSKQYTTFGCRGGSREGTLQFVSEVGLASDSSSDYPWDGTQEDCKKPSGGDNKVQWTSFIAKGCTQLKNQINASPITVAINVKPMQNYKSGIFDGCGDDIKVNHDILMVGATINYWKLKNSFGEGWGEYGFVRVKIGNTCGVCDNDGYGFTYA